MASQIIQSLLNIVQLILLAGVLSFYSFQLLGEFDDASFGSQDYSFCFCNLDLVFSNAFLSLGDGLFEFGVLEV